MKTRKSTTRRNFLLACGGVLVAGVAYSAISWRQSKETDIVVKILHDRLGQINVSDDVFTSFAREYVEHKDEHRKQLKLLSGFADIYGIISPYSWLGMGHPLRRLENNIVSNFLLSTDFFQNGANAEKAVTYLGFYDPYKRPCTNFFAQA